jgi:hypothetical protein
LCISIKNCWYIFWIITSYCIEGISKCMHMSYIIINPWPSWIETYEYFNEFINLCTSLDTWCILVYVRHKISDIWKLWSWLMAS